VFFLPPPAESFPEKHATNSCMFVCVRRSWGEKHKLDAEMQIKNQGDGENWEKNLWKINELQTMRTSLGEKDFFRENSKRRGQKTRERGQNIWTPKIQKKVKVTRWEKGKGILQLILFYKSKRLYWFCHTSIRSRFIYQTQSKQKRNWGKNL